jgi:hypothetical protein
METRIPDTDKIDLFAGTLGGKTLTPGIYKMKMMFLFLKLQEICESVVM